jgi:hypothetical protein
MPIDSPEIGTFLTYVSDPTLKGREAESSEQ